jgi:YrbI family 3-deoxy-D-manno-octulosonate 8-phosphate phosphatase
MELPKLIITDIDGVWTDGGMYYSDDGKELKKFNTSDSAGVIFCQLLNIEIAIITGENNQAVINRANKLNIKHVFLGVKNKLFVAQELCKDLNIGFEQTAYIGDDINDINLLKSVGISGAPSNASSYIRKLATIETSSKGGDGAFREFVENILIEFDLLNKVIELYTKKTNELSN